MRTRYRHLSTLLLGAALVSPIASIGCAVHAYRVHDPYYNDDHRWDRNEVVFYSRWEGDTHRTHVDFRKRNGDEQKQYWDWRHSHQ
jgi:hypothetical protein